MSANGSLDQNRAAYLPLLKVSAFRRISELLLTSAL